MSSPDQIAVNKSASDELTYMMYKANGDMQTKLDETRTIVQNIINTHLLQGNWQQAWQQAQTTIDTQQQQMNDIFAKGASVHGQLAVSYSDLDNTAASLFQA